LFPFLEYPYLINPPTLLSDEYEAIEMELNFESKNIKGGDNTIKLKYYQIFYKVGKIKKTYILTFYFSWKLFHY